MPWHRFDGRLLNSPLDLLAREELPVGDASPAAAKKSRGAEGTPPRRWEGPGQRPRRHYLPVGAKFLMALAAASAWLALSTWLARFWVRDLSAAVGPPLAWMAICGIALIPGFVNAFLAASLLLDRRPVARPLHRWPPLSILIAAFNERDSIATTLDSIARSRYSSELDVILVDDGSTDGIRRDRGRETPAVAARAAPAAQPRQGGRAEPRPRPRAPCAPRDDRRRFTPASRCLGLCSSGGPNKRRWSRHLPR